MDWGAFKSGTQHHSLLCGTPHTFLGVWSPWCPPLNVSVLRWASPPPWEPSKLFQPCPFPDQVTEAHRGNCKLTGVTVNVYPMPTSSCVMAVGDALLVSRTPAPPHLSTLFLSFLTHHPSFLFLLSSPTPSPLASLVGCTFGKCLLLVLCPPLLPHWNLFFS